MPETASVFRVGSNIMSCIRVKITDIGTVDGGGIFVSQVDNLLPDYAASHSSSQLYT